MNTESYVEQVAKWPQTGEHILASYDDTSIVVYQAYRMSIAEFAVREQKFGGEFSYSRMSWIKPNFLWMMYRSGWATKPDQERILAVRIAREFFDEIFQSAVPSSFSASSYLTREEWALAVQLSDVRLQWDPDHDPHGGKVERRAVQLGLRGSTLERYGTKEIVEVRDITEFVAEQRTNLNDAFNSLVVPKERVYLPRLID